MAKPKKVIEPLIKCIVNMSHLRIEVLDDKNQPIVEDKEDFNGAAYRETREITYVKGDEVFLPKTKIEQLGKSVSVVMAPVEQIPVTSDPGPEKEESKTPTVAETIPKPGTD